jgi:hypothetical protein
VTGEIHPTGWAFQGSAVCQLTLLIARIADGSDRRQDTAVSRAAFSAETHALELYPRYKSDDFTHVRSPMSAPDLVPAMK